MLNPFLMKRLPYNAETAFAPVTLVAEAPNLLVTNQAFPVGVGAWIPLGPGLPQPRRGLDGSC